MLQSYSVYALPADIDLYEKLNNLGLFVGGANYIFLTRLSFSYLLRFRNYINCDNISIYGIILLLHISSSKIKVWSS